MPDRQPSRAGTPWIHAVQGASMIDWPGRTAAVVFLSGCNLGCPYCHNPALGSIQPGSVRLDEAVATLSRRSAWVSSVVVSGGEPLVSPHIGEVLAALRSAGLATALNTNGLLDGRLSELLDAGLLDRVNMDLKAPASAYGVAVGLPVGGDAAVARSVRALLAHAGADHGFGLEFRTTLDRRYVGSAADLASVASVLDGTGHTLVVQAARGENAEGFAVLGDELDAWCLVTGLEVSRRGF